MKKMLFVLLTVLFITGAAYSQNAVSGRYYLSSMIMDDFIFDSELLALLGIDTLDCYIEFLGNGNCIMHIDDETTNGTYIINGNNITITDSEGFVNDGKIEVNSVSVISDEGEMIFTRR